MFLLFSAPQIDVKIQQAVSASRSSERINMSEGNEWHYWTTRCIHEGLMRLLLSHWFPSENVNLFIIHSSKVYACRVKLQKRPFIVWDTQRELLMGYQSWHIEQEGGSKDTQRWSWSRNIECWFASMLCAYISFCFPCPIILMLSQVYKVKPTGLFTCLKLIKPKPPFSEIVGVLMARKKSLNSTIERNVSQFFQYFWYNRSPSTLKSDHVFLFQDFINNYSLKTWDARDNWMLIMWVNVILLLLIVVDPILKMKTTW